MKSHRSPVVRAVRGVRRRAGARREEVARARPKRRRPNRSPSRKLGLAKPIVMEKDREVYGSEVTMKDATTLADVIKDPKAFEGKKIKVNAEIESVCLKKGCWMNVKDGEKKATVKFKDYKFFVPLDVDGRVVDRRGRAAGQSW
jgi:hypothetical protein